MILQTIVVPLDGSDFAERAVPVATALAARMGSRVVLMRAPLYDYGKERSGEYLRGVAATTEGEVEIVVPDEWDIAAAIEGVVAEHPDSMVCMTTHGRGGLRWAVLGSIAEEVVLSAEGPVLLVGRRCARGWNPTVGHVVVCHDGSEITDLVSGDACDLATAVGEQELWITTVIHPLDVEGAERPGPMFDRLEDAVSARGLKVHAHLSRSPYPAGALADAAHDIPASFLVMATHGRTGLTRLAVGSCTVGVLGLAPCPVLVRAAPRS